MLNKKSQPKTRSFLKWAGNKYHCMSQLLNAFPSASRLIEPFTGSAVVFMNTNFPSYILGESNPDLINLYQYLQEEGQAFIDYCHLWFVEENNKSTRYYSWRKQFNQEKNLRDRAAIFLYLNRHGYNGLCRYNRSGLYNVPFGAYLKPYFPNKEMHLFYEKSHLAQFMQGDFRQQFLAAAKGDLIYCDPPYAPLEQGSNFTMYSGKKFMESDQIDLYNHAVQAQERGVSTIISNHDTPFTRNLYAKAEIQSFAVTRMINCKAQQRKPVKELIAIFRP